MVEIPCVQVIELGRGGYAVDWSPAGERIAVGGVDGSVAVWGVDGRCAWSAQGHQEKPGYGKGVKVVAWSPDGERLASAGIDHHVVVWSAEEGQILLGPTSSGSFIIWDLAWSPDGRRLALTAGFENRTVSLLDLESGEASPALEGHTDHIKAMAWSPDGRVLATAGSDRTIRLWDPGLGEALRVLEGHSCEVNAVTWLPDSRRLISGSVDQSLRGWEATSGRCLWTRETDVEVWQQIAPSTDGRLIAAGRGSSSNPASLHRGSEIRIWSTEDGREVARLAGHGDEVMRCAFEPGGTRLASVSHDGTLRIWECGALMPGVWLRPQALRSSAAQGHLVRQAATVGRRPPPEVVAPEPWLPRGLPRPAQALGPACLGELSVPRPEAGAFPSLALSPDGRQLATGSQDGHVRLWALEGGATHWVSRESQAGGIYCVAFSPDGQRIASAGEDQRVLIYERATGRLTATLTGHSGWVQYVAWSPNGDRLASASADSSVRLWDPHSGEALARLEGHTGVVFAVAWSPDGRWLASGGKDKVVRLWDSVSGRVVRRLEGGMDVIDGVSFSLDGHRLATATSGRDEKAIRIWDLQSGSLIRRWSSHQESELATEAVWSPDGRLLASAPLRRNQTGLEAGVGIRGWEAESGRELACFPFPEKVCLRLAWSPDGAFLATSHADEENRGAYRDRFRLWDTRALLPTRPAAPTAARAQPPGPLSADLAPLPRLAPALARLGRCPSLALLRELADLMAGRPTPEALLPLTRLPGLGRLRRLQWPVRSHAGLIALLLQGLPLKEWAPPAELPPRDLGPALRTALGGEPIPPQAPPVPLPLLKAAVEGIDERLINLLTLVGPEAVAADPGLPLRLAPQAQGLPPLALPDRQLLGLRLRLDDGGPAQGTGGGIGSSGISHVGSLSALLPSQLALPRHIRRIRWLRSELLYRARQGQEPPRLRPTVILLDISPPTFGPVEAITRLAAHITASSLLAAQLPQVLITLGGRGSIGLLNQRPDLIELWTRRSYELADPARGLAQAAGMARTLQEEALPPAVLLLTHAWFGAEADPLPELPELRALFVQYPGQSVDPPLAPHCARWESVASGETAGLESLLGRLLG